MRLFTKGTIFIETINKNYTEEIISELENIREMAMGKGKEKIFQKIDSNYQRILKGKKGEEKLRKELMLSGVDMIVLYDIYLSFEYNGYPLPERQIDYLIITKKNLYILECKNMYTDIKIDKYGSFFYIGGCGQKSGLP